MDRVLYFKAEDGKKTVITFSYLSHKCMIVSSGSHPRAYVKRAWAGEPLEELDVHGGITFDGKMLDLTDCVGWSYSLSDDMYMCSNGEYFGKFSHSIDEITEHIKTALDSFLSKYCDETIKELTKGDSHD